MGESNHSIIGEYENGSTSMEQVKLQIGQRLNQMNKKHKFQVFSEVKEDNIKRKINSKAFIDNMENNGKGNN
jgi:hypothetical protein